MKISRIFADRTNTSLFYLLSLGLSSALYYNFVSLGQNEEVLFFDQNMYMLDNGVFLLGGILLIFSLYANQLFLRKQRRKIGLLQVSGLQNWQIFLFLLMRNLLIWLLAVGLGLLVGALFHRFLALFFAWFISAEQVMPLHLFVDGFVATFWTFTLFFLLTTGQTLLFLGRGKLNDFLQGGKRKLYWNRGEILFGVLGMLALGIGYILSVYFALGHITLIIPVVIFVTIGTYLFYRFGITTCLRWYRNGKKGALSLVDVVGVIPFERQVKKQAFSLWLITLLTGMTLTVISLVAIAYDSTGEQARSVAPFDFVVYNERDGDFTQLLQQYQIETRTYDFDFLLLDVETDQLFQFGAVEDFGRFILQESQAQALIPSLDLPLDEFALVYLSRVHELFMPTLPNGSITIAGETLSLQQAIRYPLIPTDLVNNYVFVVDDEMFLQLAGQKDAAQPWNHLRGFHLIDEEDMGMAISLYKEVTNGGVFHSGNHSLQTFPHTIAYEHSVLNAGGLLFIGILLCLSFLATTTWILFFQQLGEIDEEMADFRTLVQMGFPKESLVKGVYVKAILSFGIPLLLGILHSFFAVRAGWMFFGTSLYIPYLVIIMSYVGLYVVFAYRTVVEYGKLLEGEEKS